MGMLPGDKVLSYRRRVTLSDLISEAINNSYLYAHI